MPVLVNNSKTFEPIIKSKSMGCFKDKGYESQVLNTIDLYRDLEYFALDSTDIQITIEACVDICHKNDYKYAGLQCSYVNIT